MISIIRSRDNLLCHGGSFLITYRHIEVDAGEETTMAEHIAERLHAPGPKRMLALDGGGTRGIITIAFLERMEVELAQQLTSAGLYQDASDFRLSHYFDMIGGTSVGAMIAAQLALGHSVAEVKERFVAAAREIFRPTAFGMLRSIFDAGPVSRHAQKVVQNETLDSAQLETGLCIVMKRMDTGSVWPITNNPAARFWEAAPVAGSNRQHRRANKDYKLWELIRSSTAAPRFFTHKEVAIVEGLDDGASRGKFIDGAVSPHNSPALKMFMMAGIKGYNLGGGRLTDEGGGKAWQLGEDNLLLVSVGTGSFAAKSNGGNGAAADAIASLQGMISDGTDLGLLLLQWLGRSRRPWVLDRDVRGMLEDGLEIDGVPNKLLTFRRYDMRLEHDDLNSDRCTDVEMSEIIKLRNMVSPANIPRLYELARVAAEAQVSDSDFPVEFKHRWPVETAQD